jgi:hypothetical protein
MQFARQRELYEMKYRSILDPSTHVFILYTGINCLCVLVYPKTGKTQGYGAGSIASRTRKEAYIGDIGWI